MHCPLAFVVGKTPIKEFNLYDSIKPHHVLTRWDDGKLKISLLKAYPGCQWIHLLVREYTFKLSN